MRRGDRDRWSPEHMVEVELVGPDEPQVVEPAPGPAPEPVPGGERAAPPWRRLARRLRKPSVVVVAAAVVVVLAVGVVQARREEAQVATYAQLPGAVQRFTAPIEQRWEVPLPAGGTLAGDLAMVQSEARSDSDLLAVDLATGEVRWSVRRDGPEAIGWCRGEAGASASPVVICWKLSTGPEVDIPGGGRLVAVRATDGTVVAEHPMTLPTAGYGVHEGAVVLATREDSDLTVRRVDPITGDQQWSTDLALRPRVPDGAYTALVEVSDDLVLVHGPTSAVLSARTGEVLGTWHTDRQSIIGGSVDGADLETRADGYAVWTEMSDGARSGAGEWFDEDGTLVGPIKGFLAEPEASDASTGEVVLTRERYGRSLVASRPGTDEELWQVPLDGGDVLLRRDGAVVVADDERVLAVDLLTGRELWSTDVAGVAGRSGHVTDGSLVVVPAVQEGRWLMVAVRLDGGGVEWTAAAPPAVTGPPDDTLEASRWLQGLGGHAVAGSTSLLVGLG